MNNTPNKSIGKVKDLARKQTLHRPIRLGQLLLNEEGSEMRKLPGAGNAKNNELNDDPSNNTGVCRLGLISELGLSFLLHSVVSLLFCWACWLVTLTRWNTCSLRMSERRALRSLTRDVMSWILPLSLLSIWLVSPITRSRVSLMPPLGFLAESHEVRPELEDGVKQSLWSPASAAEKVKRPEAAPR
jgi:hypothetical protein